jgi:hypothetical protein
MNAYARRHLREEEVGQPEELIAEIVPPGEELGDVNVIDLIDPLGLRNVPGKIVDRWVDQRANRAANIAEARVQGVIHRTLGEAKRTATKAVLGTALVVGVAGGVWYFMHQRRRAPR